MNVCRASGDARSVLAGIQEGIGSQRLYIIIHNIDAPGQQIHACPQNNPAMLMLYSHSQQRRALAKLFQAKLSLSHKGDSKLQSDGHTLAGFVCML